jgi:hypothetical protein
MGWALIFVACTRFCVPTYVEIYPTKQECEAKIPAGQTGWMSTKKTEEFCVPVVKR